ncbi:MAG TPA: ABC transporter permease [Candidatus Limnocylindrales bacterium]|nr:ABC transporter permease [Candidatus Limnocylindrales bacterium]
MQTFFQDLRFGLRTLRHAPAFTIVAILTLALGIGANTAMFSVLNGLLLRALPFHDPDRLVTLNETTVRGNVSVNYANFLDWRAQTHTFSGMAAVHNAGFNLAGATRSERVVGLAVSANFLAVLGIHPMTGRDFVPDEDRPGSPAVAMLSYALWQTHFGGGRDVLGRSITLDGTPFTIIAVLPSTFEATEQSDIVTSMGPFAEPLSRSGRGDTSVIGRLAKGATLNSARVEIAAIEANITARYPRENRGIGVAMEPLRETFLGDSRTPVLVLFGAVCFVLLIACVNVANLFLVRGSARSREIAVRQAFGASRMRIVRQMLTESLVLAVLGGCAGLLLAFWGIGALTRVVPADIVRMMDIQPDAGVFAFAGGLILFVTVASGLIPALRATRPQLAGTLKEAGRGSTAGAGRQKLHRVLAVAEMALALVLLAGAGLLMKSLYLLFQVDPGFRTANVLTMETELNKSHYPTEDSVHAYWDRALAALQSVPGVSAAAVGTVVPLTGNHTRSDIFFIGLPTPNPGEFPHPDIHVVSPEYWNVLGIRLYAGRTFNETDREGAPLVAVVNQSIARQYFPKGSAVGRQVVLGRPSPQEKTATIVGVVADNKLYGLSSPARLEIYFPYRQSSPRDMTLVLHTRGDPAAVAGAARTALAAVDPDQPPFQIAPMTQLVNESMPLRRTTWIGLSVFSALALVLAAIGIYGVISYSVERRTQEIGIRMAVGARPAAVLWMVMSDGLRLAAAGAAVGIVAGMGAAKALSSLLYGTTAADPLTYAAVALILFAVAAVASYIPARRATRCDPNLALRS